MVADFLEVQPHNAETEAEAGALAAISLVGALWPSAIQVATYISCCPSLELVPDPLVAEDPEVDGEGREHPGEGHPRPDRMLLLQAQMGREVSSLRKWKFTFSF